MSSVFIKMEYIIDVQGFKASGNEFVYKEVSIVPLEEDAIPAVFVFKPPHPWKQLLEKNKCENRWLERNYHGILWRSGRIPYEDVENTIRNIVGDCPVYVKGLEKMIWLKRLLPDKSIRNVEDLGCPSLKKLPVELITCTNHTEYLDPICALQNADTIKRWLLDKLPKKQNKVEHNLLYI